MKTLLMCLGLLLLLVAPANANWCYPDPDEIGVYFDEMGTIACVPTVYPYITVTCYLLVPEPTRPSIGAWEATLLINPTSFPAGLTLDIGAGAVNALTPPYFSVCLSPARSGHTYKLVTISTFYLGGPIHFGVGPCVPSTFGGLSPGYVDGADPSVRVGVTTVELAPWTLPAYGGITAPAGSYIVAGINSLACPRCLIAIEPATFGAVKALYR